MEVLYWLALGKSDPEIAAILGISYNTVRAHVRDLVLRYGARGTNSRVMLVTFAFAEGDLRPDNLKMVARDAISQEPYAPLANHSD